MYEYAEKGRYACTSMLGDGEICVYECVYEYAGRVRSIPLIVHILLHSNLLMPDN